MLKRTQKKKNYKNRNEICEKIFLVLKRHRCIHSFQPKIPCLRQHKQAVTLHLDDRALGFPFLLEPSERGSCRKHHLLERKKDREGDRRRRDMALGRVRHSRAAPGFCTPVSPPALSRHPAHRPRDTSSPGSASPGRGRASQGFQPAGKRRDAGRREMGVPPAAGPPPPLPGRAPGTAAWPLFPRPRAAVGTMAQPPTSPPADSEHNGRAAVSRHGPARRPPR